MQNINSIEECKKVTAKSGLVFINIGTEPYTRKDGIEINLKVWQSNCIVCGAAFFIKTPISFENSSSFGAIHCLEHKLSKAQVMSRRTEKRWGKTQ